MLFPQHMWVEEGEKEHEAGRRKQDRTDKGVARDTEDGTSLYPKCLFKELIKKTCKTQELNFFCNMFNK